MATSKAKRLIALAQPTPRQAKTGLSPRQAKSAPVGDPGLAGGPGPQPRRPGNSKTNYIRRSGPKPEAVAVMPVKAHVYRSIAELNGGFEKVVQELQTLGGLSLFRSSGLTAMRELICRMRAQANRDFARADREKANAG